MRKSEGPKAFLAALAVTVVGVVWFVGGMAFNIFFFYPIILIIAGIIGMITNVGGLFARPQQLPPRQLPYAPPSQPMYYPPQQPQPQPMADAVPIAATCWQCGAPNRGRVVCLSCGAAQPTQPSQQPMGGYGAPSGYPPAPGYPLAPGYPPAPNYPQSTGYPPVPGYPPISNYPQTPGYPPAPGYPPDPAYPPAQPPAMGGWSQAPQMPQMPQVPQQPPQQGW